MGPSYGHSFVLSRPRNSDAGISISSHASFKVDKGCRRGGSGGGGVIHYNDRACVQGPLSSKELRPCTIPVGWGRMGGIPQFDSENVRTAYIKYRNCRSSSRRQIACTVGETRDVWLNDTLEEIIQLRR